MELDPRIKSVSDILTPFDTERAEQLIGQKGFFANGIEFFRDGEPHCVYGTLTRVFGHQDQTDPYLKMEGGDLYSFFLPESSLKPKEKKKWRPFTLDEFLAKFPLLSQVTFRRKTSEVPQTFCFVGYTANGAIILGSDWCSFDVLFADYELKDKDGNWTPFGVEE